MERTHHERIAGGVTVWATIAVVWLVIALVALTRWAFSGTDFGPAPLLGPERIPAWNLVALRIFEGLSAALLVALIWSWVILPWRRSCPATCGPADALAHGGGSR